jgi:hypothetical protein
VECTVEGWQRAGGSGEGDDPAWCVNVGKVSNAARVATRRH